MDEGFYAEYFRIEDRHWWFIGRRHIFIEVLDRHLGPGADRRVLDVGCGTGTMLGYLERYGATTGVDADRQAISFCHERGLENVQLLETDRLPFDDGSFDLVTAFDVLEHIRDDRGTIEEIRRVLRPGGHFLAAVPAHPWLWGAQDEISHHERRYTKKELGSKLEASKLDLKQISYFNTILFAPIAAIRLLRKIRPPRELHSDFEMNSDGRLNNALATVFGAEARWLRRADLPFGVSVLALARKPGS